jgi:hypothetical protein
MLAGAPATAFWAANYAADLVAFSLPAAGIVGLVAAAGRRLPSLQVRGRARGRRAQRRAPLEAQLGATLESQLSGGLLAARSTTRLRQGRPRRRAHPCNPSHLTRRQGPRLAALAAVLWAFGAAGLSLTYMLHPLFSVRALRAGPARGQGRCLACWGARLGRRPLGTRAASGCECRAPVEFSPQRVRAPRGNNRGPHPWPARAPTRLPVHPARPRARPAAGRPQDEMRALQRLNSAYFLLGYLGFLATWVSQQPAASLVPRAPAACQLARPAPCSPPQHTHRDLLGALPPPGPRRCWT